MKSIRNTLLAGLVAIPLTLGACGGKGDVVSEFQKVIDKMCECKDRECAEKVGKELRALEKKFKDIDEKTEAKLEEMDNKYGECKRKAMMGGK